VAASYAVALAESAQASNTLDQIHADVETFSAYSLSNAGIASVLSNPVLSDAKKKDLVAKIAKEGSFSPVFVNFLNLLITKRRINLINQVLAEFEEIYCDLSDTQARALPALCCAWFGAAALLWPLAARLARRAAESGFGACIILCASAAAARPHRALFGPLDGATGCARFMRDTARRSRSEAELRRATGCHRHVCCEAGERAAVRDRQEAAGDDWREEHQAEAGG